MKCLWTAAYCHILCSLIGTTTFSLFEEVVNLKLTSENVHRSLLGDSSLTRQTCGWLVCDTGASADRITGHEVFMAMTHKQSPIATTGPPSDRPPLEPNKEELDALSLAAHARVRLFECRKVPVAPALPVSLVYQSCFCFILLLVLLFCFSIMTQLHFRGSLHSWWQHVEGCWTATQTWFCSRLFPSAVRENHPVSTVEGN